MKCYQLLPFALLLFSCTGQERSKTQGSNLYLQANAQQEKMTGNFNIAVVRFGVLEGSKALPPNYDGNGVDALIFNKIKYEVSPFLEKSGIAGDFLGPDVLGSIDISGPGAKMNAKNLAEIIGADILIYGNTSFLDSGESTRFEWVKSDRLESTKDDNMKALFQFVVGVSYAAQGQNFTEAGDRLKNAIELAEGANVPGREYMHLNLANVYGRLGQMGGAQAQYEAAIKLNPEFMRANLGLAQVAFINIKENCVQGGNIEAIKKIVPLYDQILNAVEGSEAASDEIRAKILYYQGQINSCLGSAGELGGFELATAQLEAFLAIYNRTNNPALAGMASSSRSLIGLAYVTLAIQDTDNFEKRSKLRVASFYYSLALALGHDDSDDIKAGNLLWLSYITIFLSHLETGTVDCVSAKNHYNAASDKILEFKKTNPSADLSNLFDFEGNVVVQLLRYCPGPL